MATVNSLRYVYDYTHAHIENKPFEQDDQMSCLLSPQEMQNVAKLFHLGLIIFSCYSEWRFAKCQLWTIYGVRRC